MQDLRNEEFETMVSGFGNGYYWKESENTFTPLLVNSHSRQITAVDIKMVFEYRTHLGFELTSLTNLSVSSHS